MGAVAAASGPGAKVDAAEQQRKAQADQQKAEAAKVAADAKINAAAEARKALPPIRRAATTARQEKAAAATVAKDARKDARKPGQTPSEMKKSKETSDTADKKLEDATGKSKAADAKLQEAEEKAALTATRAEEAMRKANALALAECKAPPYSQKDIDKVKPTKNELDSAFEGTSRKAELEKVLGLTPPPQQESVQKPEKGESPSKALKAEDARDAKDAPVAAAQADAERLRQTLKPGTVLVGPVAPGTPTTPSAQNVRDASRQLESLLTENKDPAYRKALLDNVQPHLKDIGKALYPSTDINAPRSTNPAADEAALKEAYQSLSRATDALPREEQRKLAQGLAADVGRRDASPFDIGRLPGTQPKPGERVAGGPLPLREGPREALRESIQAGNGDLAMQLAGALQGAGRPGEARQVAGILKEEFQTVRKDFEAARENVKEENEKLARIVLGFDSTLPPDKLQKAIEQYRNDPDRKDKYDALEKQAERLGALVDAASIATGEPGLGPAGAALKEEARGVVGEFGHALDTKAGEALLRKEVDKQAKGEESFLNDFPPGNKVVKDGLDFTTKLAAAVTKGTAQVAFDRLAKGDKAGAKDLFNNLEKNHALFGVPPRELEKLSPIYKDLLDGKAGAADALRGELGQLPGDVPGGAVSNASAGLLRGLGVVAGLIGAAGDWKEGVSEGDVAKVTKALGDTLSVTADGANLVLSALATPSAAAAFANVAGKAAGVGNIIGVIGDGIAAYDAFSKGETLQGFSKSASVLGGAILAKASLGVALGLQPVPLWGQVAGGVLVAGGVAGSFLADHLAVKAEEATVKEFLEAGGVSPRVAGKLNALSDGLNAGFFIEQLAQQAHKAPQELLRELESLDDKKLDAFMRAIEDTPHDEKGKYVATDKTPGQLDREFNPGSRRFHLTDIRSLDDAVAYLRRERIIA